MSELTELEGAITKACRTIASDWPALTEAEELKDAVLNFLMDWTPTTPGEIRA